MEKIKVIRGDDLFAEGGDYLSTINIGGDNLFLSTHCLDELLFQKSIWLAVAMMLIRRLSCRGTSGLKAFYIIFVFSFCISSYSLGLVFNRESG